MKYVYVVLTDGRENGEPVHGVFDTEEKALTALGEYHREVNDSENLGDKINLSNLELGKAELNQYSCIIGSVEAYRLR